MTGIQTPDVVDAACERHGFLRDEGATLVWRRLVPGGEDVVDLYVDDDPQHSRLEIWRSDGKARINIKGLSLEAMAAVIDAAADALHVRPKEA